MKSSNLDKRNVFKGVPIMKMPNFLVVFYDLDLLKLPKMNAINIY